MYCDYGSVGGAPEPYGSCVFVSQSFREIAVHISQWSVKIKNWNTQCKLIAVLLCLGGWSPEAYGSRRVFVCVSAESFPELVLRVHWKLSAETCNASLTQYYFEMKLVDFGLWLYCGVMAWFAFSCSPWRLFFTDCPETIEEQAAYKGLLSFQLVSSICIPQGRQWAKLNWDIQDVEGTRATSVSLHSVI